MLRAGLIVSADIDSCSLRRHYPNQVIRVSSQPAETLLSTPAIKITKVRNLSQHHNFQRKKRTDVAKTFF